MATAPIQAPADPLAGIASILQTLGGTRTTTSAGDTGALQSVLAQLQGQDYTALLQGIFQQAAGQIPGLQAAYGNAVGARSGGNSAVQAALQALLQQTTLAAQQQIATQQNQNLQTQTQAASGIANATRGTTQRQGTDLGGAAKSLAVLQLLSKLGQTDTGKQVFGDLFSGKPAANSQQAPAFAPASASPLAMAAGAAPLTSPTYGAQPISLESVLQTLAGGTAPAPTGGMSPDLSLALDSLANGGTVDYGSVSAPNPFDLGLEFGSQPLPDDAYGFGPFSF